MIEQCLDIPCIHSYGGVVCQHPSSCGFGSEKDKIVTTACGTLMYNCRIQDISKLGPPSESPKMNGICMSLFSLIKTPGMGDECTKDCARGQYWLRTWPSFLQAECFFIGASDGHSHFSMHSGKLGGYSCPHFARTWWQFLICLKVRWFPPSPTLPKHSPVLGSPGHSSGAPQTWKQTRNSLDYSLT